jgi:peroxiredoxin
MMNRTERTFTRTAPILVAAFLVLVSSTAPSANGVLAPGQPAPDLTLQGRDGKPLTLTASKGRPVLVDFWASWCPPCRISIPALDSLYREFHDRGLDVIAINVDERRKDADEFIGTRQYAMPIVFDPRGNSPREAGVYGMPTSFLVDRSGKIRFVHRGYSDKVLESYRREVLQLLAEMTESVR